MAKLSVIYVHWAMDEMRSKIMRRSLTSLMETAPDAEILVADNGGSFDDSQAILEACDQKKIAAYVRFRENMHFAYARNVLLDMATGDYICICDNDIVFEPGWAEEIIAFLEKNPDLVATPLVPDISHRKAQFWVGERDGWQLNSLAGSSCFVMPRSVYNHVGKFLLHNMAGSKYARELAAKGHHVACMPQCKAVDIGERAGYDWRNPVYSQVL